MEYIEKIKKMLCKELDEYAMKGKISGSDLDMIWKLTDIVKNLDKISMLEESEGYSEARGGRGRSYMHGSSYDDDMMYSERRGRGRNAKRDSMGRYSSEDGSSYDDYSEESSKDIPVFIHVARYAAQKNQKLLFSTFERLHNNGKKFLLIVIGANYEQSPYMHLNETDYIKILGAKQNVGDYLACANYFVLSSTYEGLPLSLLEAMSMGCIPVSTPAGGVVDVIRDGENGLLSPSFEENDFYSTIAKVFEKDFTIDSASIIKEYKENYTMEVCVNKYYDAYKKLLNRES